MQTLMHELTITKVHDYLTVTLDHQDKIFAQGRNTSNAAS